MSVPPCPFCGKENTKVVIGSTYNWVKVKCAECDASCGEVRKVTRGPDITPEDRQAAYKEWSIRA